MSYTSVISEAWKLLLSGKKYAFYYLASTIGLSFLIGIFVVILVLIAGVGVGLGSSSSSASQSSTALLGSIGILGMILGCVVYFFFILLIGAIDAGVYKGYAEKYRTGEMLPFTQLVKKGFKYFIKYFFATLLVMIPMFIVIFVLSAVVSLIVASIQNTDSVVLVSMVLLCLSLLIFIPIYFIFVAFFISIKNAIIIEEKGLTESISYAYSLVKSNLKKFIIVLLVYLLVSMVALIPYYCLYFGSNLLQLGSTPTLNDYSGSYSSSYSSGDFLASMVGFCMQMIASLYLFVYVMYAQAFMIVAHFKITGLNQKKEEVKISEPVMAKA